ncbi:hypothetical protein A2303_03060 [Candidatus Falkowbacteria bacterium RIFOXYB2_FULL_47_14]|uniref:Uncharacterized protein n=1 Tax=Candidatus Falkowbacteria bacterium RIFOXYA2_FULL_47_19 TaxID=1797994 RepID=A0A1F5SF33_9BACT|nr:MAG: hypothetical protein A2227_07915 [Candidatus Falkowbacteria bacterium RIFOXYA2_FULL_47_19]OGF35168.1 MAG: hypothetical protein A2468_01895 [Candidatus Falkowbacteria bacterium RIFOXYC2_FULL_46_15]OGF43333.1 MAG: hypothetical protein A2303_03060 [Candidatus Falkowbacteria bacterium RIFOXYB2_FULL_47_14]
MDKDILIKRAVGLIAAHFGDSTAKMYEKHFSSLSEDAILATIEELLSEIVGPSNAKKQTAILCAL